MNAPEHASPASASLEQLVALNDEIAALVRAGVPLAAGLEMTGRDLPGRMGGLAAGLAQRLARGESLPQAIAASPAVFPPVYAAVVEAGLAAGRLPAALEGLSVSLRRVANLRRTTGGALIYPLLVLLVVYVLFLFSITRIQPRVQSAYRDFRLPESRTNAALVEMGRTAGDWGPWLPVAIAVPLALCWVWSGRSAARGGRLWRMFRAWSPAKRLAHYGQLAAFAEILALLVEHDVPLHRALALAGDASGGEKLSTAARDLAGQVGRGASVTSRAHGGIPPLVGWLLAGERTQGVLATALRHTADLYRGRAERLDDWLRLFLPIVLTLAIGGTAVVLYALSVFVPWYGMLDYFAKQPY